MKPQTGMLAVVRNRSGIISRVEPSGAAADGLLHLVTVDFTDRQGTREETFVWEREPSARPILATGMPRVVDAPGMPPLHLDALIRATRWSALRPYIEDGAGGARLERMPPAQDAEAAMSPDHHSAGGNPFIWSGFDLPSRRP